jgi:phosphoribosylformimino-5-aminoimidazole carboxamide ribonucleotide (ProFAR) isomerase
LLDAGAERVVVGTAAFGEPTALDRFCDELGHRLVVAVDVREGHVVVGGWAADTQLTVEEAVERCVRARVPRLHCTAVDRDGTLGGPDLELLARVVDRSGLPVVAAGGIGSTDDLAAVAALGCEAAIVGTALLDGRLALSVLAGSE